MSNESISNFANLVGFLFAFQGLLLLGALLHLVLFLVTSGVCLHREKGIDRLTWLVAIIGIPVMGSVFYFFMRDEFAGNPNVSEEWKEEMRKLQRGG